MDGTISRFNLSGFELDQVSPSEIKWDWVSEYGTCCGVNLWTRESKNQNQGNLLWSHWGEPRGIDGILHYYFPHNCWRESCNALNYSIRINWPVNQVISKPVDLWTSGPLNQPLDRWTGEAVNQLTSEPVDQWTSWPINQLTSELLISTPGRGFTGNWLIN